MYVGVVLAAGGGLRMGEPKAEIEVGGARLLDRAIEALRRGGCAVVIAVVREGVVVDGGGTAVVNPDPGRGMRSSLEIGLEAAARYTGVDAVAVTLVDLPGVDGRTVRTVLDGWQHGRIAVGRSGDHRVHPTVMAPLQWTQAVTLAEDDEGARRYLDAHADLVDEIEVSAAPDDLDTPDDLAAWRARR